MNVIFDLDGTLSDNRHRQHLAEAKEWDKYTELCIFDDPKRHAVEMCNLLYKEGYDIRIHTGRSYDVFKETIAWLGNHQVAYRHLKMRPTGTYMPDTELKRYWLEEEGLTPENTLCVFEDRDSVVRMYRDLGFACYQVADGGF